MASGGYPGRYRTGQEITGIEAAEARGNVKVFHAGTAQNGTDIVTSGGRVLCVTALGSNVRAAQRRAYEIAEQVRFDGMQYRRDIGHRAVAGGPR